MAGETQSIILGYGVFNINGVDVALSKGGGKLEIAPTYVNIEADGDYGVVKGRILKFGSTAKLTINALTLIVDNFTSYMPGLTKTAVTTPAAGTEVTGSGVTVIPDTDFQKVTWTGKTKDGKSVIIELDNAINLEKFDWDLKDKEQVVSALTYTATYDEAARTTEPWSIIFGD